VTGEDPKTLKNNVKCKAVIEQAFSNLEGEMRTFFGKLSLKATKDKIWELCYICSFMRNNRMNQQERNYYSQ